MQVSNLCLIIYKIEMYQTIHQNEMYQLIKKVWRVCVCMRKELGQGNAVCMDKGTSIHQGQVSSACRVASILPVFLHYSCICYLLVCE